MMIDRLEGNSELKTSVRLMLGGRRMTHSVLLVGEEGLGTGFAARCVAADYLYPNGGAPAEALLRGECCRAVAKAGKRDSGQIETGIVREAISVTGMGSGGRYLKLLAPRACANYAELSHGAERMSIRYAAQFAPGGLADLLRQRQEEELRAGQSLCGIHREDLELLLDDQPARVYASQGQQRSVVLSLKMAEAAAAAQITGEHPVLLLDDVLSELDEGRKQYLLTCMKEKQTFVTSCDDTDFLKTDGEVYRMDGGVLNRV